MVCTIKCDKTTTFIFTSLAFTLTFTYLADAFILTSEEKPDEKYHLKLFLAEFACLFETWEFLVVSGTAETTAPKVKVEQ